MVECDHCNRPVLSGVLLPVTRHIEEQMRTVDEHWCLNCLRGTGDERERREQG
jgi:hypothetical protein